MFEHSLPRLARRPFYQGTGVLLLWAQVCITGTPLVSTWYSVVTPERHFTGKSINIIDTCCPDLRISSLFEIHLTVIRRFCLSTSLKLLRKKDRGVGRKEVSRCRTRGESHDSVVRR